MFEESSAPQRHLHSSSSNGSQRCSPLCLCIPRKWLLLELIFFLSFRLECQQSPSHVRTVPAPLRKIQRLTKILCIVKQFSVTHRARWWVQVLQSALTDRKTRVLPHQLTLPSLSSPREQGQRYVIEDGECCGKCVEVACKLKLPNNTVLELGVSTPFLCRSLIVSQYRLEQLTVSSWSNEAGAGAREQVSWGAADGTGGV